MGNALVTNNAVGTLASSMSDSVLTAVLNSGQGALFPNPTGSQYFYVTLIDASNNKEIVKVTARSLNTLTIVRAQDNTTARAFDAGDRVELRPVAALHNNYPQLDSDNTLVGDQDITGDVTVTGAVDITGDVGVTGAHTTSGDDTAANHVATAAAGSLAGLVIKTGSSARWDLVKGSGAESGSNVAADLYLRSFTDAGAFIANAMIVARATGIMTVLNGFKIGSDKGDHFPAGTKLCFPQAAAPTGWVNDGDNADTLMRINSGVGGGSGGSWTISGISVDNHTLTWNEMPAHQHYEFYAQSNNSILSQDDTPNVQNTSNGNEYRISGGSQNAPNRGLSGIAGSSAGHNHTLTIGSAWRPKYLDFLKCSKS